MALRPVLLDTENNKLKCGDTITVAKLDRINALLNLACCCIEAGDNTTAKLHIDTVNNHLGLSPASEGTYTAVRQIYEYLNNSGVLEL